VAKAAGLASGDALAGIPGYDPTPRRSGGWLVWDRFDVAASRQHVDAAFGSKGLVHHLSGKNLVEVLESGVLASSERRRLMGVKPGKGMSESADMTTGGAKSVFLRVGAKPAHGPMLFWADPARLLRRSDWYAYASDHFGSLNADSHHSTSGQTRSPATIAGFGAGNNEVMLRHGIDLLGGEAPSHIICSSKTERSSVLALLKKRGIAKLAGRPVEEVVMA
jgi:hypothetical protein